MVCAGHTIGDGYAENDDKEDSCSSGCMKNSAVDETFHGFLKLISKELGATASLFDIPTLFNPSDQRRSVDRKTHVPGKLPVHTLCEYEPERALFFEQHFLTWMGLASECSSLWHKYITNPNSTNPYLAPDDSTTARCAHGLGTMAK